MHERSPAVENPARVFDNAGASHGVKIHHRARCLECEYIYTFEEPPPMCPQCGSEVVKLLGHTGHGFERVESN